MKKKGPAASKKVAKKSGAAKTVKKAVPARAAKKAPVRSSPRAIVSDTPDLALLRKDPRPEKILSTVCQALHDRIGLTALNLYRAEKSQLSAIVALYDEGQIVFASVSPERSPVLKKSLEGTEVIKKSDGVPVCRLSQGSPSFAGWTGSLLLIPLETGGSVVGLAVLATGTPAYTNADRDFALAFLPLLLEILLQQENSALKNELQNIARSQKAELQSVRSEAAAQIESARAEAQASVKAAQSELSAQLSGLKKENKELSTSLKSWEDRYVKDLEDLRRSKDAEREAALKALAEHEQSKQREQLKTLESDLGQVRKQLAEVEASRDQFIENQLKETRADYETRLSSLKSGQEEALRELRASHDSASRAARQEYEDELANLKTHYTEEVARIKEQNAADKIRTAEEYRQQIKLIQDEMEARAHRIQTLETEKRRLAGFESECEKLRTEIESRSAAQKKLTEDVSLARMEATELRNKLEEAARDQRALLDGKESEISRLLTEQRETHAQEISAVQAQVAEFRKMAAELQERGEVLQAEKEEQARAIGQLEATVQKLRQEKDAGSSEREQLKEELTRSRQELQQTRSRMGDDEKSYQERIQKLGELLTRTREELETEKKASIAKNQSLGEELEATRARLEAETGTLAALRKEHEILQSNSSRTQKELEATLSTLKQELADSVGERTALTRELQANQQKTETERKALESRLSEATGKIAELEERLIQAETNYHNRIYEETSRLSALNEKLNRQKNSLEAENQNLTARLREGEQVAEQKKIEYDQELLRREKEREKIEGRSRDLEQRSSQLRQDLDAAREMAGKLERDAQALRSENQVITGRLEELKAQFSQEKLAIEKIWQDKNTSLNLELQVEQKKNSEIDSELKKREARIQQLMADLSEIRGARQKLESNLQEKNQELRKMEESLAASKGQVGQLRSTIERLEGQLKNEQESLNLAHADLSQLRVEIGIHRERQARLEQDIAGLQAEIHSLKNKIAAGVEREKTLKTTINKLNEELQELRRELSASKDREQKLKTELSQALERERGSKEEGALLARLVHSISHVEGLSSRIQFLLSGAFEDTQIDRILAYSLTDESTLRLEDGMQQGKSLAFLRNFSLALKETTFGNTIASGSAARIEVERTKKADLPEVVYARLKQELGEVPAMKSFITVPLRERDQVIGVLTIASVKHNAFDDRHIRLLHNTAPLLAIALRHEQHMKELEGLYTAMRYQDGVLTYLNNRFNRAGQEIVHIASSMKEKLEGNVDESALYNLKLYSDLPLLSYTSQGRDASDFAGWIRHLARSAAERTNIETRIDLEEKALRLLSAALGHAFKFLFYLVSESIENIIRHSQATMMQLELKLTDSWISFSILDNGEGLIRTTGSEKPDGQGLQAIRNLALFTGGSVDFSRDENGHGHAILIRWNLENRPLLKTN